MWAQEHPGLRTGIGASGRAYRYRVTQGYIRVKESGFVYRYRGIRACKLVQEHRGLQTSLGAFWLAYRNMGTMVRIYTYQHPACPRVQGHPSLYAETGASRLTFAYRSTQAYIWVYEHLGLSGLAYRHRSFWACIQVEGYLSLHAETGAPRFIYVCRSTPDYIPVKEYNIAQQTCGECVVLSYNFNILMAVIFGHTNLITLIWIRSARVCQQFI